MPKLSYKEYFKLLTKEMELIEGYIDGGNYEEAIRKCDSCFPYLHIAENFDPAKDVLRKKPLSVDLFFNISTAFYYLKSSALILKINALSGQVEDTDLDKLYDNLKSTISTFHFYHKYFTTLAYRRRTKPVGDILMAEYAYLVEEGYELAEWLRDCSAALNVLKRRRGKKNQMAYAKALVDVACSTLKKISVPNQEIRALIHGWFNEAGAILQKYSDDLKAAEMTEKIFNFFLRFTDTDENFDVDQAISSITAYEEILEGKDDLSLGMENCSDAILFFQFIREYLLANQSLKANNLQDVAVHAKNVVELGSQYLSKLKQQKKELTDFSSVMSGMTTAYFMLSRIEKDPNYLDKALALWRNLIEEIQNHNREKRDARRAKAREEGSLEHVTREDLVAVLSGEIIYHDDEAIVVLTAQCQMAMCYLCAGDLQKALSCKKEMEYILENNMEEEEDDEGSSVSFYLLYLFLSEYYSFHGQEEEAEKYRQLYVSIENSLRDFGFDIRLAYDRKFLDLCLKPDD